MPLHKYLLSALVLLGLLCSLGCERSEEASQAAPDADDKPTLPWLRRQIIEGNANPRLQHGLLDSGFYQPLLGPDWMPYPLAEQQATLISQSRIIYLMAMAYEVTGEASYRQAMKRAAGFLLDHFADPDHAGHWFRKVGPDGSVLQRGFHTYGQAQVIFALSHAFRVSGEPRYRDAALRTWLAMDVRSAIAGEHADYPLRGLNVTMHLFESLLALYKATDSALVREELQLLGDYIIGHFFDPEHGMFVEGLTPELERQPDGEVRLGHAIEMAFLLSRAVDAGLPASWLEPANRSVDFVAHRAAVEEFGLIPHTTDYDGKVRDPEYYWWSQCELLRGLGHFIWHRDRRDLTAQFYLSLASVEEQYIDPTHGGWYRKPYTRDQVKGEEWKVGYHVTMMLSELMRLKGARFQSGDEVLL